MRLVELRARADGFWRVRCVGGKAVAMRESSVIYRERNRGGGAVRILVSHRELSEGGGRLAPIWGACDPGW